MMEMKRYILAVSLGLACVALSAQNFNESVEVTNDLLVDLSGSQRKTVNMNIPDSISKFKLNFDYSVFAQPYKGAYEFTPYNVLFRPLSQRESIPRFYVSAGAGYTFAPTFQAVYAPRLGDKFYFDVYQDFNGYVGDYNSNDSPYSGYELSEQFGLCGRALLKPFDLSFGLSYNGLWAEDFVLAGKGFHSLAAKLDLSSSRRPVKFLNWSLGAEWHFASDRDCELDENAFSVKGMFSPKNKKSKWQSVLNYSAGVVSVGGQQSDDLMYVELNPRLEYENGRFFSAIGFKIGSSDGFYYLPDMEVALRIFKNSMKIYAALSGEASINSYYGFKMANPHFSSFYLSSENELLFSSRETVNACVGIAGSWSSHFEYGVKSGYAKRTDAPLYSLISNVSKQPKIVFADGERTYAQALVSWKSSAFDLNADALYQDVLLSEERDAFLPAEFRMHVDGTYKSLDRLFLGASVDYVGERRSRVYATRPSYLDLGVHADFRFTPEFTLWMRGSNLLSQSVEICPFTGRHLPSIVMGIRLIVK